MAELRNKGGEKMKKKRIIIIFCALLFGILFSITKISKVEAIEVIGQVELKENYYLHDTFTIPSLKLSFNNQEYETESYLQYPSGNVSCEKIVQLDEVGEYTITYVATINKKNVIKEYRFVVHRELYSILGSKSTMYYGAHSYMPDDVGIVVSIAPNETFLYNKPIDLSMYNSANQILTLNVLPETIGEVDAEKIIIKLTDVYDAENVVTIEMKKCDDNRELWAENNTYVVAYASNQDAIGLESDQTTGNLIVYNGKTYRFHRNNPYGARIAYSMPGAPRFQSITNPNYDPAYVKEQRFSISMDYQNGIIYAGSNATFVTDLKSDVIYGNNLWNGFTTGEAYLSISAISYKAEKCNLFLETIGNQLTSTMQENVYVDKTAPFIDVDLKDYREDDLPVGQINQKFNLFKATAYDDFDKEVEVKVEVYLNLGLSNECKMQVVDNAFIPKYKANYDVVYTAVDQCGNKAEKILTIKIDDSNEFLQIDSHTEAPNIINAGQKVEVQSLIYKNNQGSVEEKIVATLKENPSITYEVVNHSFTPLYAGTYLISYSYQDYISSGEYSYEINVLKSDIPAILSEITLPKYFIRGCTYQLPNVDGYSFSTGAPEKIDLSIMVKEDDGVFKTLPDNAYTPQGTKKVVIKYVATNKNQTCEKQVEAILVDVNYQDGLDISKYMFTNQFTAISESKYIEYTTNSTTTASMEFINPLQANHFSIKLTASEDKNQYSKINLYLTDSQDETIQLKFTYGKTKLGNVLFSINDENSFEYETLFSSSSNPIELTFDGYNAIVSPQPNKYLSISSMMNHFPFKGFTSQYVYLKIEIEGCKGDSALRIFNVCGQPFTKVRGDIIDPIISSIADTGDKNINQAFVVRGACISDVLDPNCQSYFKVTDPDNLVVRSVEGVLLDERADYTIDHTIVLEKYGTYVIYYQAIDSNENQTIYSYVVTVVDQEAPKVRIVNPITSAKVNSSISIASLEVYDNSQDILTIYACVKTPSGQMISLATFDSTLTISKSFTANSVGEYTIYYYVVDSSGNSTCIAYTIKVY